MTTLLVTLISRLGAWATRRPRLALVLLCALLWTPGFLTLPPGDRDESRFMQATKQMLETGDYVRIMNGTEARNRKPIGIHWMQAPFVAAARALGLADANPVWPYRVPSFLGGLAAVLACFAAGQHLVGRRAALLGAGVLAASVVLVVEVHIAKTDAALLGATTIVMALLARAYLDPGGLPRWQTLLFWAAMGVGVLLKGPITPMVAGAAVIALVVADRRAAWLRGLHAAWGVPVMMLLVAPWFIAIGLATEGRFFADAVGGDLGRKLTSGDDAHWGPPGMHLLLLPVLLFPLGAALPGGVLLAWRDRRAAPVRFLLAWIVPAWLVFEAAPTKLPHYTLPLYPAICLLLAAGVLARPEVGRNLRRVGAGFAVAGAGALAAAGLAAPVFLGLDPWLGVPVAAASVVVGWFAARAWGPRGAVAAIVSAPLAYGAALGWELPRLWPVWIAPRLVAVLPPGALGTVGFAEPSLMALAGTGTQWLRAEEGVAALADGAVAVLVVGDRDLVAVRDLAAARGLVLREVAAVPGYNYSRGRRVLLTVLTR